MEYRRPYAAAIVLDDLSRNVRQPHAATPILIAAKVTVDYPGVRALNAVTLNFYRGEIHAIVGENGAGKSTLMKVLSGAQRPTAGGIELHGKSVQFANPADAIHAGISMVHQELNLVPSLNVAENITLGQEPRGAFGIGIDRTLQRTRATEMLHLLGSEVAPDSMCGELSIAEAQFVEIAKCLATHAEVLILDEPTAVLGESETAGLFRMLQTLRNDGRAVIFISHHLDEVVEIADRISVLRDGALVQTFTRDNQLFVDEGTLAATMVGRKLGSIYPAKGTAMSQDAALQLIDFGAQGISMGVNLVVRPGEIVGIAGLVGSGRTETAEAILGLRPSNGVLKVNGKVARFSGPRAAMDAGISYTSEDRKGRGLHVTLSAVTNTTLPSLDRYAHLAGLTIDHRGELDTAARRVREFTIKCADTEAPIASLSGGNQQKFALARSLETYPKILIIDEPTRGVDVGAKEEIYRIITKLAAQGLACLIISSELPELIGMAHRVIVMRNGQVMGEVSERELSEPNAEERIMRLASGLQNFEESP